MRLAIYIAAAAWRSSCLPRRSWPPIATQTKLGYQVGGCSIRSFGEVKRGADLGSASIPHSPIPG